MSDVTGAVPVTYKARVGVYQPSDLEDWLDPLPERSEPKERAFTGHLAGSHFNELVTCAEVATDQGLESVRIDRNGDEHFHHPEAQHETSLTVYAEDGHCACWSDTMHGLYGIPLRTPMDAFGLWTWLRFSGDFSVARAFLIAHGISDRMPEWQNGQEAPTPRQPPTLGELLTHDDEEYDWLIPGLIERGDRTVLTGKEGEGKSTLLRYIGITAAAGLHPFTLEPMRSLRVLLIDCENSVRQLRREFTKALIPLVEDGRATAVMDQFFVEVHTEGLVLDPTHDPDGDRKWLEETIAGCRPEVVILGPTYKTIQGESNDEPPNRELVKFLDRLRGRYGFSILLESHTPHDAKRPYGWSGWKRWPEFGLHLDENGQLSRWRGDRDARQWPERLVRGAPGGWLWEVADLSSGGAPPDPDERKVADVKLSILRAMGLAGKPLSRQEIEDRTGKRRSEFIKAFSRLRDQMAFTVTTEDRLRANGRSYPVELFEIDPEGPYAPTR